MNFVNEMFYHDEWSDWHNVPTSPCQSNAEVVEEFISQCEVEAEKLEVTVDYYLAEFV